MHTCKLSVMTGTLVYVFGSCECHPKLTKEMFTPLRHAVDDSSSSTFLSTGKLAEIGREKYLIPGR